MEKNMDKNMKENKEPGVYLFLRIIGFALLAIGIIVLIVSLLQKTPSMGDSGWYEAESARSGGICAGIGCILISIFLILMGFMPSFKKIEIQTKKYIMNENKEDLTNILDTTTDISKDAIVKTTKAVKKGLAEDTMFCKHCGEVIDSDSKFCNKCGKEQ